MKTLKMMAVLAMAFVGIHAAAFAVESGAGLRRVTLTDGQVLQDGGDDLEVALSGQSSSATVVVTGSGEPVLVPNGGTLTAGGTVTNILDRATYWADASVPESLRQVAHRTSGELLDYTVEYGPHKNTSYPSIDAWYDCRGKEVSPYYLRKTDPGNIVKDKSVTLTNPYLMTNDTSWTKGNYVSLITRKSAVTMQATRAWFNVNNGVNPTAVGSYEATNIAPKLVIMVYGSQDGGGGAVIAANDGSFARTGTTLDDAILPAGTDDVGLWVDGVKTNGATAKFSGHWQIISIDANGRELKGVGYDGLTATSAQGGQNLAEVLCFDEQLTDNDRVAVERYLAAKWGLSYQGPEAKVAATARANGAGTVKLASAMTLGGVFTGTVDLNGQAMTLPAKAAPSEDEVKAIGGRCGWFDPSNADTIAATTPGKRQYPTLNLLNDVDNGDEDGAYVLCGSNPERAAALRDNWMDLRKGVCGHETGTYPNGATMRFNVYPTVKVTTVSHLDVQTLVMAQNSTYGGGTPFLQDVNSSSSYIKERIAESGSGSGFTSGSYETPIWSKNTSSSWKAQMTPYVDGIATDGETRGFNGRPEVFTTTFDAAFPLGTFGYLYGNTLTNAQGEVQGEVIGEILCYSRKLADSERRTVEAYLMNKWCARSAVGYGDLSGATVTGAGEVNVPTGARLPAFATGFAGTVRFAADAYAFTIDSSASTTSAVDPIIIGSGEVAFPAAATVSISTVGSRIKAGEYVLVQGAGVNRTAWTLDRTGLPANDSIQLKVTADSLVLSVPPNGLMLLFR